MASTRFTTLLAVLAAAVLSVDATRGLRAGCEYAPTVTPTSPPTPTPTTTAPAPTTATSAPTTETPVPTTETPVVTTTTPVATTPVPANGPPLVELFDASGKLLFSRSVVPVGKCIVWTNCFQDPIETIAWQTLGPAGTSITFFGNAACANRGSVASFRGTSPQTVRGSENEDLDLTRYGSFVVLDSTTETVDTSDIAGCVAPAR